MTNNKFNSAFVSSSLDETPKWFNKMYLILPKVLVLVFTIYSISLAFFSVSGFPEKMQGSNLFPFLADKPISEDAFYMLSLAWNLGKGNELTYNYNQLSTGVQPFITFVYGGIAYLLNSFKYDKWDFIRTVLIFNLFLIPVFYFSLRNLLKKIIDLNTNTDYILFLLIFFNGEIFRLFSFGLETGLYLIFIVWAINYSLIFLNGKGLFFNAAFLGFLFGITVLTRIDFLIIILILTILLFVKKKIKIRSIIIIGIVCFIVAAPWFAYVHSITGSFIPSSGGAQSKIISESDFFQRVTDMVIAVLTHVNPWLYSGGLLKVLSFGLIITIMIFLYKRKQTQKNSNIFFEKTGFLKFWGLAFFSLIPVYFLFFWASHFYIRYTSPLLVFILLFTVIFLYNKLKSQKSIIIFAFFMVSLFFAQNIYAFHLGRVSNNHLISAGYINQHYSSSVKVGAFQSGVIGYLNENVINLDGKVNMDALAHIKNNNLDEYLDKSGIKVMIDWESCIQNYLSPDYLNQNWVEVQRLKNALGKEVSICLERK